MKRGLLLGAVTGMFAVIGVMMYENCSSTDGSVYYEERTYEEGTTYESGWAGARAYLNRIRANEITGEINPADVLAAREQSKRLSGKTEAIGLNWENLGPNNIGGRTRAILFDKDNPSTVFTGGVSGGLFKSTNGGASWQQVNDFESNLAVVSLAQGPNGTIYYGTGEGLYYFDSGIESGGILGGGMFKSTDGGATFQVMPSTQPAANNPNSEFASIGKIEVDPNNAQRIYAATNLGLRRSSDAGATWETPAGIIPGAATDMDIDSQGGIWVKQGAKMYFSETGEDNSFTEITDFPILGPRARMAVAPTDDNYVYVITTNTSGGFREAWQTKDRGQTWSRIGQNSAVLNPHRTQGRYNNALAVSPLNKERIIVGGVTLWEWSESNGWLQMASLSGGGTGSPLYVHADNHAVAFHPNRPNEILIGNDGGIFKSSNNGITWVPLNQEYVTTQFYSIGVGYDGSLLGGTQDNGTIFVSPESFFAREGVRTASIEFKGALVDGDGGYAEISHLNPLMAFKEMQYGVLGRSADSGESFAAFYDFSRMDPSGFAGDGTSQFADFVMPFLLWEKLDEPLSADSITFTADSARTSLGFGSGINSYTGQLPLAQPTTQFVPDGLVIEAGLQVVTSDANGNLQGDGTGTFNPATGEFTVTFTNPVVLEINAACAVSYAAGSVLFLESETNDLPIDYTLVNGLAPNESVKVQDPVQSMFFAGLRAYDDATNPNRNRKGGIWMTREAISSPLITPEWFHIAKLGNNETPSTMEVSPDGNTLYVGTNSGRLWRITNLNNARDSASTDVDDFYLQGNLTRNNTSVVESSVIRNFNGRAITGIAVNSQNLDQVVVTLGNYGNTQYVFRSNNALDVSPTFQNITGDLPAQPVYSATFNYNDPTAAQLIIGSEDGIYATEDVNANAVTYLKENTGMANVPVFSMRQPRTVRYDLLANDAFEGAIYLGTHGRGYYKSNSTIDYIGIDEPTVAQRPESKQEMLNVFPNPASSTVNVPFVLEGRSNVIISVRDLSGKQVKLISLKDVDRSVDSAPINVESLKNGTYIITLQVNNEVKTGKLVVTH
jgi:photosystem II stability/assembly factor-like uncharacterized protein